MKGFISAGTALFITFLIAIVALGIAMYAARSTFVYAPKTASVVVPSNPVVSPTVETTPTASPSAAVLKKTSVVTEPVKTVVVTVTPIK